MILRWQFLTFIYILAYCLLAFQVSDEKSHWGSYWNPLWWLASLAAVNICSLLAFKSLNSLCLGVGFFEFTFTWSFGLGCFLFHEIWEVFTVIFQIFFSFLFSVFFPSEKPTMHTLAACWYPKCSLDSGPFLQIFLPVPALIISIVTTFNSLILLSAQIHVSPFPNHKLCANCFRNTARLPSSWLGMGHG